MYHSLHVSVQKNVSSATRPFLFCPASGYFASLASESLLTAVAPSLSSSRAIPHFIITTFPISDTQLSVFLSSSLSLSLYITTDLPFRALVCSIQHPAPEVHVPYSTSTALEAIHPFVFLSCFCAFARPPLVDPDALRDHLNRVGLGSSLSCCYSAFIRPSISIC